MHALINPTQNLRAKTLLELNLAINTLALHHKTSLALTRFLVGLQNADQITPATYAFSLALNEYLASERPSHTFVQLDSQQLGWFFKQSSRLIGDLSHFGDTQSYFDNPECDNDYHAYHALFGVLLPNHHLLPTLLEFIEKSIVCNQNEPFEGVQAGETDPKYLMGKTHFNLAYKYDRLKLDNDETVLAHLCNHLKVMNAMSGYPLAPSYHRYDLESFIANDELLATQTEGKDNLLTTYQDWVFELYRLAWLIKDPHHFYKTLFTIDETSPFTPSVHHALEQALQSNTPTALDNLMTVWQAFGEFLLRVLKD